MNKKAYIIPSMEAHMIDLHDGLLLSLSSETPASVESEVLVRGYDFNGKAGSVNWDDDWSE